MPVTMSVLRRGSLLLVLVGLLASAPAAAQYITFPRIGVSAAADTYEPRIEVFGDEPFDLHIMVMPPDGQTLLSHDFQQFQWALLEPCCGGAATILATEFTDTCTFEGNLLSGMTTTANECLTGEMIHLGTMTLRMEGLEVPGTYFVLVGPTDLAYDCNGDGVVMTDLIVEVAYTPDITPIESNSLSEVKQLFD
jgi:hypothetical protein